MNLKRWHQAVNVVFYTMPIGLAALLTRMPEVKTLLNVNSSQLGLILLGGALGSMSTLFFAGKLISRYGTRNMLTLATWSFCVALISFAVSIANHSVLFTIIAAFVAFAGAGLADVSINLDGSQVEQQLKRTVMPRMHAFYSLGSFSGAAIGTLCVWLNVPLVTQTVVLTCIQFLIPIALWKILPGTTGKESKHEENKPKESYSPWKNSVVYFLGIGILGMTLAEGATNDWLVLGFKEGLNQTAANAGLAYVILQVGMVSTRFFGGRVVDKIGRRRSLEILALAGIIGILLVTLSNNLVIAYAGTILWGAGVSMAFPLFLGAAGESSHPTKNVATVATFGYMSFLLGPPVLGLLAQTIGILNMFYVLLGFLAISAYFARATDRVSKA